MPLDDASRPRRVTEARKQNTVYGVIDRLEVGRIAREEGHAICHSLGWSQERALYGDA